MTSKTRTWSASFPPKEEKKTFGARKNIVAFGSRGLVLARGAQSEPTPSAPFPGYTCLPATQRAGCCSLSADAVLVLTCVALHLGRGLSARGPRQAGSMRTDSESRAPGGLSSFFVCAEVEVPRRGASRERRVPRTINPPPPRSPGWIWLSGPPQPTGRDPGVAASERILPRRQLRRTDSGVLGIGTEHRGGRRRAATHLRDPPSPVDASRKPPRAEYRGADASQNSHILGRTMLQYVTSGSPRPSVSIPIPTGMPPWPSSPSDARCADTQEHPGLRSAESPSRRALDVLQSPLGLFPPLQDSEPDCSLSPSVRPPPGARESARGLSPDSGHPVRGSGVACAREPGPATEHSARSPAQVGSGRDPAGAGGRTAPEADGGQGGRTTPAKVDSSREVTSEDPDRVGARPTLRVGRRKSRLPPGPRASRARAVDPDHRPDRGRRNAHTVSLG
ncbi:hypothetical protein JHW43_002982 [Diplocarpon mali]|nr:hypothetical protein JHW43_002982 [Diplocarpon mali]